MKHYVTVPLEDLLAEAHDMCTPAGTSPTDFEKAFKEGVMSMLAEVLRSLYDHDQECSFHRLIALAVAGYDNEVQNKICQRLAERNAG